MNTKLQTYLTLCGALILAAFALSCARSFNPDIERGSTYKYREGFPDVRLSAIGLLNEGDEPVINVTADVVYGSLIYKKQNGQQNARFTLETQIIPRGEDNTTPVKTRQETIDVSREDPNIINSQETYTYNTQIPIEPGEYEINLTVIDQNSNKRITRQAFTYIPDPSDNVTNFTNIQLLGKRVGSDGSGEWSAITTYDVQGSIDSLMFRLQVTNNDSDKPLTVNARLLRFRSDTTIARPMHFNNYSPSSIQYKGIDYDEEEELQTNRRTLIQPGSVLIEYKFGQQDRGNYRFEVESQRSADASGESEPMYKARDFGVKSKNYPAIKAPIELARPLHYLMSEKEYKKLVAIEHPDSLKQAVDRFWLKALNSKSRARQVIKMYYQRVEEANKQFSNFKEGWKTDLGMMYVLFGPPWYIDQRLDQMVWSYSYNRNDPEYNYLFETPKMKSEFFPFQNYLLQRRQFYFNVQYQQTQLWLTGQILRRQI